MLEMASGFYVQRYRLGFGLTGFKAFMLTGV
jgi:hypothetical protein